MLMTETGSLWSVSHVARRLRISRMSVYRRIEDGQLEAYRVGVDGDYRIPPEAVERLLRPARDDEQEGER